MWARYRFVLRPGWLITHVMLVVTVVAMVLLGRWQLHVSEAKHFNVRNFGYTLQWWAFSAFAVVLWLRIIRDASRRGDTTVSQEIAAAIDERAAPVAYRRYVMPMQQPITDDDPVRSAYNSYLADLAAQDGRDRAAKAARRETA